MQILEVSLNDAQALAEIRAIAMKPSLEALGRYDPQRVKSRFLDTFIVSDTWKIQVNEQIAGFFVLRDQNDHFYLDHLYIHPDFQNQKLGSAIIEHIVKIAKQYELPIHLGALRGSQSNQFYLKHGFQPTHEDEFDIYYEYLPMHDF